MSDKKRAYEHSGEVTGFGSEDTTSHEAEHRETTAPSAEERNELAPEKRGRRDRYGPRTHPTTRITSKDERDPESE